MKFEKFKHFISLGYNCFVASDLDEIGLREFSLPFDWSISSLEQNLKLLNNHFEDFMIYENMSQNKNHLDWYKDTLYDFYFYHDFDKTIPLERSFISVKEKYLRRINRLYLAIEEPSLFIRYISKNSPRKELKYIERNYDKIVASIKKFNNQNEIIFISDKSLKSNSIKIFYAEELEKNGVSKHPLLSCREISNSLKTFNYNTRSQNLSFYRKKAKLKNSFNHKIKNKIYLFIRKFFKTKYIHTKQYTE